MGLRERKREQTRSALADAALDLFAEHGYEKTTIADIADRAGVSPRTFFTHYASKEEVLFCGDVELMATLGEALDHRPAGQQTLDAVRDWLVGLLEGYDIAGEAERERLRRDVIDGTPVLLARQRQVLVGFEVLIRAAVAKDLGETPDDLRPRLVAATAAAALDATHSPDGTVFELPEVLARLDQALAFLRGGLEALNGD